MRAQIIQKFSSIKAWKHYCFNTHKLYLKNIHFRKWITQKEINILNFSNLKKTNLRHIKLGIEDAIKEVGLHFKVNYLDKFTARNIMSLSSGSLESSQLLKMIMGKRKLNHKDSAFVLILDKPIKTSDAIIKDGEALTYVPEGVIFFSFDHSTTYPNKFLMCRAKHETFHLLGLNFHHEDTEVKGYKNEAICNMRYNAPTQHLCEKCKNALLSFWEGIEYATKKQFIKN